MIPRRIVLEYLTGSYAGLRQIVGTEAQLREKLALTSLPTHVPEVVFLDHQGACSLKYVKKRYVQYVEEVTPVCEVSS